VISRLGTAAVVASAQVAHTLRAITDASDGSYAYTDQGKLDHPWIVEQIEELRSALLSGRARVCPHLRRAPQTALVFAQDLEELRCGQCVAAMPGLTAVEDVSCDRCQRYCRGLWSSTVGVRAVVLFVALCARCCSETGRTETGFAA